MSIKQRKIIFIPVITLYSFFLIAGAQSIVTIHEGAISIIRPDGAIIPIGKGDDIPRISPGSIIDVMEGKIEVAPVNDSIKVAAVDSITLIKPEHRVVISIHPRIQMVEFRSIDGNIDIITGNIKTSLRNDQAIRIGLDKYTGTVYIQSIFGNTASFAGGSRILIMQNSSAQVRQDPMTLMIAITATAGKVDVFSIDGIRHILNHNDSINLQGIAKKMQFEDSSFLKTVAEAAAEDNKTAGQVAAKNADVNGAEETTAVDETASSAGSNDDFYYYINQPSEMPPEPEIVEASPYLP